MKPLNIFWQSPKCLTLLASLVILHSCMTQMSESVTDKSIGLNGSFEHVRNNLPVNWLAYTPGTIKKAAFELSFDTSDFKEGKQSLKYTVQKCSDKGGRFSPGISQEIAVHPGEEYSIRFWIKNKGAEFSVAFSGVNAFKGSKGPELRSAETIDTWRLFEYQYKIPEAMDKLKIDISVLKPGLFWIDDLRIEKSGAGTES